MNIIAECGVNFDNIDQAFTMIENSKESGCAYTKFQLYDESVIKDSPLQAELRKRMITRDIAALLVEEGEADGQPVFFTPMFVKAVDWIEDLGCKLIKIRYNDRQNIELINRALDVGVPVMISIDRQYTAFYKDRSIKLLYCVPKYPAAPEDYQFAPEDFSTGAYHGAPIFSGVSDHTKGVEILGRAKVCGAEFCECHAMIEGTQPIEAAWSKTLEELGEWIAVNT